MTDGSDLSGKNALVTGGSRGIGRAICEALAARGASVVVNYRAGKDAAEEVVAGIAARGGTAVAVQGDIAEPAAVPGLFEQAAAAIGPLDIVVSNAAIVINKPFDEYTVEDFDTTFATNARGAFFVLQHAASHVRDGGRIIAISSGGTRMLLSGTTLYLGSKGAVEQFVRGFAQEVADRAVTVNAVLPGFTETDMTSDELRQFAAERSPFNRIGQPREVAAVVAFLASNEAGWITAQSIGAGGGVM